MLKSFDNLTVLDRLNVRPIGYSIRWMFAPLGRRHFNESSKKPAVLINRARVNEELARRTRQQSRDRDRIIKKK